MKDKNVCRKFFLFNMNELGAMKEYLEEMALEGWMLTDIKQPLKFVKIEPKRIFYSVEIFSRASIIDARLNPKSSEFVAQCAAKGWEFVSSNGKVLVFKTTDPDAQQIEPDEKKKYKAVINATLKQYSFVWILLPILLSLNMKNMTESISTLVTSNIEILLAMVYLIFMIVMLSQIISFLVWRQRARNSIKNGGKLPYYTKADLKIKNRIRIIPAALILLMILFIAITSIINGDTFSAVLSTFMFLTILGLFAFSLWFQKQALSRASNIIVPLIIGIAIAFMIPVLLIIGLVITSVAGPTAKEIAVENGFESYYFTVNNDKIPITINDMGIREKKYRDKTKSREQTILTSITRYEDSTFTEKARDNDYENEEDEQTGIFYDVFDCNYDFITDLYLKEATSEFMMKKIDAKKYGAKAVYLSISKKIRLKVIIAFDTRVISFYSDVPLRDDAIGLICKKLKPNIKT